MRAEFSFLPDRIFLNHAGVSPLPQRVRKAMVAALESHDGQVLSGDLVEKPQALREALASLAGVSPSDMALVPNTSTAVSMLASGLKLRAGEEILLPEAEYPANAYGWLKQRDRGLRVTLVPEREGRVTASDLLEACGSKTRLIAVSSVQFGSGYRVNLDELGEGCRKKKVLLFVDAAQSLGVFPLNAGQRGISFAAGSGWKWLLGPPGTGWLFVSAEALDLIDPPVVGAESMAKALDDVNYSFDYKPDTSRFEPGGSPSILWAGLEASASWLAQIGPGALGERILALTAVLAEALRTHGWEVVSPRGPGEGSGIVSCRSPRVSSNEAARVLLGAGVQARVRRGWLRLSPHAYNTEQEMEKAVSLLPKG